MLPHFRSVWLLLARVVLCARRHGEHLRSPLAVIVHRRVRVGRQRRLGLLVLELDHEELVICTPHPFVDHAKHIKLGQ